MARPRLPAHVDDQQHDDSANRCPPLLLNVGADGRWAPFLEMLLATERTPPSHSYAGQKMELIF